MGDLLAGKIQVAQEICGVRVPQVGRLLVQLYGPAQADRYPNAVFIAHTQGADPIGIVLLCRLGVQLYRSGGIHFHPAAHLIVQPQEELRPGKILLRRLTEQLRRLGTVLFHALAVAVQHAQIALGLRAAHPGSLLIKLRCPVYVLRHTPA